MIAIKNEEYDLELQDSGTEFISKLDVEFEIDKTVKVEECELEHIKSEESFKLKFQETSVSIEECESEYNDIKLVDQELAMGDKDTTDYDVFNSLCEEGIRTPMQFKLLCKKEVLRRKKLHQAQMDNEERKAAMLALEKELIRKKRKFYKQKT